MNKFTLENFIDGKTPPLYFTCDYKSDGIHYKKNQRFVYWYHSYDLAKHLIANGILSENKTEIETPCSSKDIGLMLVAGIAGWVVLAFALVVSAYYCFGG